MRIVAFSGNLGSGKDTAAEILVKHGWRVVALADRIKQLAHTIFKFDEQTLFGPSENRNKLRTDLSKNPSYWDGVRGRAYVVRDELRALFINAPTLRADPVEKFMELIDQFEKHADKFSARHVLQQMGTEWGRSLWSEVWIHALGHAIEKIKEGTAYDRLRGLSTLEMYYEPPVGVIAVDCRFENEIDALLSWGGEVYWIDASKRCPRDLSLAMNTHASEPTSPEDFGGKLTGVIDNNGTLAELQSRVHVTFKHAA